MLYSLLVGLLLTTSCDKHEIAVDPPSVDPSKLELVWESDVLIESPLYKIHGDKLITVDLIKNTQDSVIKAYRTD
jgi:hypothetical protein